MLVTRRSCIVHTYHFYFFRAQPTTTTSTSRHPRRTPYGTVVRGTVRPTSASFKSRLSGARGLAPRPRPHSSHTFSRHKLGVQVQGERRGARLKKPRLPSALGLSGACGVEAYTRASLSTLTPLSPLTPYRPPPSSYSCTLGTATSLKGGGLDCVHYLSPNNRVGGKG
eukprot:scaffold4498_cov119-Isochrysis_galbana.AAC.44